MSFLPHCWSSRSCQKVELIGWVLGNGAWPPGLVPHEYRENTWSWRGTNFGTLNSSISVLLFRRSDLDPEGTKTCQCLASKTICFRLARFIPCWNLVPKIKTFSKLCLKQFLSTSKQPKKLVCKRSVLCCLTSDLGISFCVQNCRQFWRI